MFTKNQKKEDRVDNFNKNHNVNEYDRMSNLSLNESNLMKLDT